MNFLDMQELATVAAQADLCRLLLGWCTDNDLLLGLIEGSVVGGLVASVFRARGKS
ncbi:MAG TPA: hypothetical protein VF943_16105 [Burkholderiales bacterium]